jgi:hypothetical protein
MIHRESLMNQKNSQPSAALIHQESSTNQKSRMPTISGGCGQRSSQGISLVHVCFELRTCSWRSMIS